MSARQTAVKYAVVGAGVVAVALGGVVAANELSTPSAESSNPRITIFCSEFVPNMEASSSYKKWALQNLGERDKWIAYRTTICLDELPVFPIMVTSFGKALIAAGKMALTIDVPPPTTTEPPPTTTVPPPTTTEPPPTTTVPPPAGTVALWVDLNGGTCVRSPGAPYADAQACGTFDAAWDKASSGDIIMVKAGTYPRQAITGNKTSTTKIIGENGTTVADTGPYGVCSYGPAEGNIQASGNFMWLENVTIDAGSDHGQGTGGCIDASNVTYRNVNLYGNYVSLYLVGANFTWQGGLHGAAGLVGAARSCANGDGQPIWIESSASGATIDGVTFGSKKVNMSDPTCGSDNTFHMENIRVQTANNVTVRNVLFKAGSDVGSGHIFITSSSGGTTISGLKVEDAIFEPVDGTYAIQIHNNVSTYSGWTFKRNRFDQPILDPGNYVNLIACGNTGQVPASWKVAC